MTHKNKVKFSRRDFIKHSGLTAAGVTTGLGATPAYAGKRKSAAAKKKVIVIGIDGMDPRLSEKMMDAGKLPNFAKLRQSGGYSKLGTSIPPQSPVAWANFINGAGPGSHGIFDFIHRNPSHQFAPFFSAAETISGKGYWEVGDHRLQLDFWPFNHQPSKTVLRRQGVPFWDYLDAKGISSTFYNLPSNYPPSPSKHGNHRCLSGMGTPDLLGTYGTYQHYAEDGPIRTKDAGGGRKAMLFFEENETAKAELIGPTNTLLKKPVPAAIEFTVHRDTKAKTALIEIQGHRELLRVGRWSKWIKLDYELKMPAFLPDKDVSGICRFYLQEVTPNFRLYVTPINTDPSEPFLQITEPADFIEEISDKLGLFYTTGFQEDHKALTHKIFTDSEFADQADYVLRERLNLLQYALDDYDDGLLFFYFSSTDLQAHMFWWDSDEKHPTRSAKDAKKYFGYIHKLYQKLDGVIANIMARYGDKAAIIVISDHGFANFKRQFNLNTWLRVNGYIAPADCTTLLPKGQRGEVPNDWAATRAYGLGINGLYLNLKGRERDGIVKPGKQHEELLVELTNKLEAVTDANGRKVIRKVHRTDEVYKGSATTLAPDLILGYSRDYRASWSTCLGDMDEEPLSDNMAAWSADHCADVSEVPGVIFSNRPIIADSPALIDLGPSILKAYGLPVPPTMTGKNILGT